MTTRPSRLRSALAAVPWAAAVLGVSTAAFTATGVAAMTAQPRHAVSIEVDPGLPLGITQGAVDAVVAGLDDGRVAAWEPLTLRVTRQLLSYDELRSGTGDGTAVLSLAPNGTLDDHDSVFAPGAGDARFNGVSIGVPDRSPGHEDSYDVEGSYEANIGLGHGPAAVVATAQRLADKRYDGPVRTQAFWLAGSALGAVSTAAALAFSLRRTRIRTARRSRFAAARRKLARVLLDLEGLELTHEVVPAPRRTEAFTETWARLRQDSLELSRREQPLAELLSTPRGALGEEAATLLPGFEREARGLTRRADALLDAGSVLGSLAGGSDTWERLAAPVNDAARELLARLESAPPGLVPRDAAQRLRAAVAGLLGLAGASAMEPDGHAHGAEGLRGGGPAPLRATVRSWAHAERAVASAALAIGSALRRAPHGAVVPDHRDVDGLNPLRASLGLPPLLPADRLSSAPMSRDPLRALDLANAAARSVLGHDERFDAGDRTGHGHRADDGTRRGEGRPAASGGRGHRRARRKPAPRPGHAGRTASTGAAEAGAARTWKAIGAVAAIAALSAVPAGIITATTVDLPDVWGAEGGPAPVVRVEDRSGLSVDLDTDDVATRLDTSLPRATEVTVAVLPAAEYLGTPTAENGYPELERGATVRAMERVKTLYAGRLDPGTHELPAPEVIVPLFVYQVPREGKGWWDAGDAGEIVGTSPFLLAGAVQHGDAPFVASLGWDDGVIQASRHLDHAVQDPLEALARGMRLDRYRDAEVNGALLFWMLTLAFASGALALVQAVRYGGALTASLGRFGRGSRELRAAKARLDALMVGLDESRLNAVAVLGRGPAASAAEADQRLHERALVMAWREAGELAALPLSGRLGAPYAARVRHLRRLVATLQVRDGDMGGRARELLAATRGAGGDAAAIVRRIGPEAESGKSLGAGRAASGTR